MFAYETIAARNARLPHANGFGAMRHLLALGIVIFHGFVLATGDAVMPVAARALADPILPGFFASAGFWWRGAWRARHHWRSSWRCACCGSCPH